MGARKPDFTGWATVADLVCTDGRVISDSAFGHQDKMKVPLVWSHKHDDSDQVLGHAILELKHDADKNVKGMYCYAYFNENDRSQNAKRMVQHGDVESLSIWANGLVEKAAGKLKQVLHGSIREVSLVLAGANSGAKIDFVNMAHADGSITEFDDVAIITMGLPLEHEDATPEVDAIESGKQTPAPEDKGGKEGEDELDIQEIYDGLSDEEKDVVEHMVKAARELGAADANAAHSQETPEEKAAREKAEKDAADAALQHDNLNDTTKKGPTSMKLKHSNVFEGAGKDGADIELSHDQIKAIFKESADTNRLISDVVLSHATEYGIENIDFLFPDAKTIADSPEFVSRKMEWVVKFLQGSNKRPFAAIKSMSADITHEEARAKGYIKGTMKKEEWFALAKRETRAQTVYKKQKLDRDDIIDATTLNVVAWMKAEMLVMLDEEVARAGIIGDGRPVEDPNNDGEPNPEKIREDKIRPIAHDDDFYTVKIVVPTNSTPEGIIKLFLRGRKQYRGNGNPVMWTTEDLLTDMLLITDKMGRDVYDDIDKLKKKLRVSDIVTVEVMEGHQTDAGELLALFFNPSDYTFGTDPGGETTMFEDFDIDFNQNKYLIERRQSGALTKFHSAIALCRTNGTLVDWDNSFIPGFNAGTGVLTVPNKTGVVYKKVAVDGSETVLTAGAQTAITAGQTITVVAEGAEGYAIPHNTDRQWDYTRNA